MVVVTVTVDGLSAGAVAGITVVITLLVSLPVGVVIGCCSMWCMMRHGRGATSGGTKQKMEQLQGAMLSVRSQDQWILPFLSVTTRPMATSTCRGGAKH